MADLTQTLKIVFEVDGINSVASGLSSISNGMTTIDSMAREVATPFANVFDWVVKIDGAIATLTAGTLAYAITEAGKFSTSFNEISTLFTTSDSNLNKFKDDILDYATKSTQSIENINQAVYSAISAGTEYSKSLDVVANAEKLAVAGKADLNATTVLLASTMNAYGLSVDEAQRVSDSFFKTVQLGQTTIPELASSIAQVTGVASSAGVNIEQLNAAIAVLTASGMPTSQAVTSIKAALSNIIKPSSEAQKAADTLGIQFDVTALKSKGLAQFLIDVYNATGGNVEIMGQLFGSVEGLNAVLALGANTNGKYTDTLKQMENSAGATEEAFKKMSQNLDLQLQNMQNAFRAFAISFGTNFEDEIGGVLGALGDLFSGFKVSVDSGALDPLIDEIKSQLDDAKRYIESVADVLPEAFENVDLSNLLDSIENLKNALSDFFDVDLTTESGLTDFLQTATDGFASLLNITSGMIEELKGVWKALEQGIDTFKDVDSEQAKTFGAFLTNMKLVAEGGIVVAGGIKAIKEDLIELQPTIEFFGGIMSGLWNTLKTVFDLISSSILATISSFADFLDTITFGASDKIGDFREKMDNLYKGAFETMKDSYQKAAEGFSQSIDALVGGSEEVSDALEKTGNSAEKASEQVGKIAKSGEEGAESTTKMKQTWDELKAQIGITDEEATSFGNNLDDIGKKNVSPNIELKPKLNTSDLDKTKATVNVEATLKKDKYQQEIEKLTLQKETKFIELKIANINAETEKVKEAFRALANDFESVTSGIPSLFGSLLSAEDTFDRWRIEDAIRQQLDIQRESFDLQKQLIEAQIELYNKKAQAVANGQGLITIDSNGLEPALEMVLWNILEKVQLKIAEEQSDFLLGCTG